MSSWSRGYASGSALRIKSDEVLNELQEILVRWKTNVEHHRTKEVQAWTDECRVYDQKSNSKVECKTKADVVSKLTTI